MKTGLHFWIMVCCGLRGTTVWASHAAGGQITYEYIGTPAQPTLCRISCLLMNGCPGFFPATVGVNCRVGTFSTASTSTDPRNSTAVLTPVSVSVSDFYCSAIGNNCTQNLPLGYTTRRYPGTAELPPAPLPRPRGAPPTDAEHLPEPFHRAGQLYRAPARHPPDRDRCAGACGGPAAGTRRRYARSTADLDARTGHAHGRVPGSAA